MPYPGYTGWLLQIDPPAIATGRSMLDINNPSTGIQVGGTDSGIGIDWGQAAFTQYEAQEGQWGSAPADFIVPNRTITIPLGLGMGAASGGANANTALANLSEKVGLLQREGGWLMRQRNGGAAMYCDIVDAELSDPDVWGETAGVEPNVTLTLTCLPDFYGDEIALDVQAATGVFSSVLTSGGSQATIQGDYPARTRIIVTDTSGNNQLALPWGARSRYYSGNSTAALFYEAETLTPLNTAAVTGLAGASGGSVVQFTCPSGAQQTWIPILSTNLVSGGASLTHLGTYEVWARVYSPAATPQLRLQWGAGGFAVPATNTAVLLPGSAGFYLVDLGTISIGAPSVGNASWFGAIEALMNNSGDIIDIDCVYFQPLTENAGKLTYQYLPLGVNVAENAGTGADNSGVGTLAWNNPSNIAGTTSAASVNSSSSGITHYLEATNFGFSIPSGATILGIVAGWYRSRPGAGIGAVQDNGVFLMKAGSVVGSNRSAGASWSGISPTLAQFGSSTDLWGTTWASTDINNSGFGVALSAKFTVVSGSVSGDIWAPVTITVYYQLASGLVLTQDAVVYANQSAEVRWDQTMRQNSTGSVYGPVSNIVGDLARLPPSGLEGRAAQLFAKPTRGDLNSLPDAGLDTFTVQVKYRPCYLSRP